METKRINFQDCEKCDKKPMTSLDNLFQVHKYGTQLCGDFDDLVHDKIYVNWYSSSIYDVYFHDNCVDNYTLYNDNNSSKNIINDIFNDNFNIECRESMKGAPKFFFFNYVDNSYCKFTSITSINVFSDYVDTIHIDEPSLRFAFYYSKNQWKRIIC